MTWLRRTNADPGALPLSGKVTAGVADASILAILDELLVAAGWTIAYQTNTAPTSATSNNGPSRTYRMGGGSGRVLFASYPFCHPGDSGDSMALHFYATQLVVLGADDATGPGLAGLVNPFHCNGSQYLSSPPYLQNDYWYFAFNRQGTISQKYVIYASETFVLAFFDPSNNDLWTMGFFGDVPSAYPEDQWNTVLFGEMEPYGDDTTTPTGTSDAETATGARWIGKTGLDGFVPQPNHIGWARSLTGQIPYYDTTPGTYVWRACGGRMHLPSDDPNFFGLGRSLTCAGAGEGVTGTVDRIPLWVSSSGDYGNYIPGGVAEAYESSMSETPYRGVIPHLWAPLHNGPGILSTADTFRDDEYNPAAVFRIFKGFRLSNTPAPFIIVEETDTWEPPL